MTLKPFPVQVPFKPSRKPSGVSVGPAREKRRGLLISGIGVNAKSGSSSISPLRLPVARTINLHYRGQLARAREQRQSNQSGQVSDHQSRKAGSSEAPLQAACLVVRASKSSATRASFSKRAAASTLA